MEDAGLYGMEEALDIMSSIAVLGVSGISSYDEEAWTGRLRVEDVE